MGQYKHIAIALHPVTLDAFETRSADYFNYDAAQDDGVFSLTVHPEIFVCDLLGHRLVTLNCRYDPEHLPEEAYGLPMGDEQLQLGITRHIAKVLPIDPGGVHFESSGHALQAEGLLAMEAGSHLADRIDAISSHEWIDLISHPQVARITFDGKDGH
jgi:hypothetical protein